MEKKQDFRILFLIASPQLGEVAQKIYRREGIMEQIHTIAKGTATGEWQSLLGLGEMDKDVILTLLTAPEANRMLQLLREELYLGSPGSGVAFTVPMNGASLGLVKMMETYNKHSEWEEDQTMKSDYSMIFAFVNQGFSEEVMEAAREAGAGGGTVFHSRRVAGDQALEFWGIRIQEEREIVLILASKKKKSAIMEAISARCGIRSDAHGMVISVPVDEVAGLKKFANPENPEKDVDGK